MTDEYKKKISEWTKVGMTQEVKRKISNSRKGKIWINNGYLERCINNINGIPEGFIKGRLKKQPNY